MANQEEDFNMPFYIPQNYTDNGKALGGMVETRNLVEAIVAVLVLGYVELNFIHTSTGVKIVIMILTILPIALLCFIGLDGYSLSEYMENLIKYIKNKRRLHLRRVDCSNAESKKDGKEAENSKRDKNAKSKGRKNKKTENVSKEN